MIIKATENIIKASEEKMGVQFPERLKQIWRISNGIELPDGWRLYPVYDPQQPRKTNNDIRYENTKGRWDYMDESFISIADGETGNRLVLKNNNGILEETIYLWNHETNKTKKWGRDFEYLLLKAKSRIEKIEKQIEKSHNKKNAERIISRDRVKRSP